MHVSLKAWKRSAMVVAGAGLALALAACSSSATPSATPKADAAANTSVSGSLNLLAYASVWQEQYQKAVIDPFLKLYPNVHVNYVAKGSSSDMLSSLQSEGTPTTDVAIMDVAVSNSANKLGLFQKLDPADYSNLSHVEKQFQSTNGYGPVVMADAIALIYDTTKVKKKPTSWEALWDKKYAGQIGISAPPSGIGINLTAVAATLEGEDFTKSIDKAVAKLKELKPNVATWVPSPDDYQSVITGQTVMDVGQNARAQYYSEQTGGKLGISIPKEGTVYQLNTINLRKGAPDEKIAKLFINYALSGKAQTAFAEALFYAPTVTDAKLPADVAKRVVATDGSNKIIKIDQEWLSTVRGEWTDRWKREIIGG